MSPILLDIMIFASDWLKEINVSLLQRLNFFSAAMHTTQNLYKKLYNISPVFTVHLISRSSAQSIN